MKELLITFLALLPHAHKNGKLKNDHTDFLKRKDPTVTISENITIKEDPKTKQITIEKKSTVKLQKIEIRDKNGERIILYIPKV